MSNEFNEVQQMVIEYLDTEGIKWEYAVDTNPNVTCFSLSESDEHIVLYDDNDLYSSHMSQSNVLRIWQGAMNPVSLVNEFIAKSPEWNYYIGAIQTWNYTTVLQSIGHAALGLVSELAELHYVNDFNELHDEIGDIEYYLSILTWHLGIPGSTFITKDDVNLYKIIGYFADVGKKTAYLQKWNEKTKLRYNAGYNALQCLLQDTYSEVFPNKDLVTAREAVRSANLAKLSNRRSQGLI